MGITRTIEIGGLTKPELKKKLQDHSIRLNEYGERLLADDQFILSVEKYRLPIIELTLADLGFPDGATMPEIIIRMKEFDLELCPLELGPYLRLAYLNQPEADIAGLSKSQRAPSGSITIASEIIRADNDFPKGFYLRNIDGVLWLRGYIADDLHVWSPTDHFIFCNKVKL